MKRTNQPEQNGKYWKDWESVLDNVGEHGAETRLMMDGEGQFHTMDFCDYIDGKPVPTEDYRDARMFFKKRGMAYDAQRVRQRIQDNEITAQEAARLFLEEALPECLMPFVAVR
jgi:hypothetical protein